MGQIIKRHGVTVTLPGDDGITGVSDAEREHLLARLSRRRLRYRLDYKGYPGHLVMIPDKDDLWRFKLGYGFHYRSDEMLPSRSAYTNLDSALGAAIKMFVEGRKLSRGKPQRDVSAMAVARHEKARRRRK